MIVMLLPTYTTPNTLKFLSIGKCWHGLLDHETYVDFSIETYIMHIRRCLRSLYTIICTVEVHVVIISIGCVV